MLKKTKNPNKKLNKALDDTTSKLVKQRDGYRCIRCSKQYQPGDRALTCSHFWSRTKWKTRWDLSNLDTVCLGCHRQIEHDKQGWYMGYKVSQLGTEEYAELERRSNEIAKWTRQEKEMMLEQYQLLLSRYADL